LRSAHGIRETIQGISSRVKTTRQSLSFFDEIQYIDQWERFVNFLNSQRFSEPCELFISGSNSNLLSGELLLYCLAVT
jgi:predicted AAA+ superfamily ATPase